MPQTNHILAIDQGTSGTKAIIFDQQGQACARGFCELKSYYPQPGFVEQDPEEIFQNVITAVSACLKEFGENGGDIESIKACGISNQRETFVLWDHHGQPLTSAVVWQCKRSITICDELKSANTENTISQKTGLIIDPYFSGTKVTWLKRNNQEVKAALKNNKCYFGTMDTWLLFRLTHGRSYATDYTNACRTLFFDINTLTWDQELLKILEVEKLKLPEAKPSDADFGESDFEGLMPKPIHITGMIGDSHAAAFGEQCFDTGSAKITLGTGSSILWNTGENPVYSKNGLITTICWSTREKTDYALEGVIVSCGSIIEWLKNQLAFFDHSAETEQIAESIPDSDGVMMVPAFSGMGAPCWKMDAKAAITGLTFGSTKAHIVRAALESIAYQIKDVIDLMADESNANLTELNANGGMTRNHFLRDQIGKVLGIAPNCSTFPDISALGAAFIAGLGSGLYKDLDAIKKIRLIKSTTQNPSIDETQSALVNYEKWKRQVRHQIQF
jgi:glycerol kinase